MLIWTLGSCCRSHRACKENVHRNPVYLSARILLFLFVLLNHSLPLQCYKAGKVETQGRHSVRLGRGAGAFGFFRVSGLVIPLASLPILGISFKRTLRKSSTFMFRHTLSCLFGVIFFSGIFKCLKLRSPQDRLD